MEGSLRAWRRLLAVCAFAGVLAAVFAAAAIGLSGDDGPLYTPGTPSIAPSDRCTVSAEQVISPTAATELRVRRSSRVHEPSPAAKAGSAAARATSPAAASTKSP